MFKLMFTTLSNLHILCIYTKRSYPLPDLLFMLTQTSTVIYVTHNKYASAHCSLYTLCMKYTKKH